MPRKFWVWYGIGVVCGVTGWLTPRSASSPWGDVASFGLLAAAVVIFMAVCRAAWLPRRGD